MRCLGSAPSRVRHGGGNAAADMDAVLFKYFLAHPNLFFRGEGAVPKGLQIHVVQMQVVLEKVNVLL